MGGIGQLLGHPLYLNGLDICLTQKAEVNGSMLTLGNDPDRALCRFSKISDRNSKFHLDGILEQKCFGASQMCVTIAINANLPRACLIINRETVLSMQQE